MSKRIVIVGGVAAGAPQCVVSLNQVLATCKFDVVDIVPIRRQNLAQKLPLLRSTGQWLADEKAGGTVPSHLAAGRNVSSA